MSDQLYFKTMKILFSADWHIKLGQKNVPRDWQMNRYNMLFDKIHELEKEVDIHILGGDVFDREPKPQETSMFFNFIKGCTIPTYIYDGNHEATRKGKTFLTYFKNACRHINGNVNIIEGITEIEDMDIIPYTHLKTFNPEDFNNKILFTHVRGEISPHVFPEIDLELLKGWDIVLAGDLHAYENSQRNIIYPGSPLSITFHRQPITNGVVIFDSETYNIEWIDLKLPQLIRKTVDKEEDIIKTDYDHTIYEITGNILELSGIDTTSNLIDKKIVNRKSDITLDLSNKSIEEEFEMYLRDIVKLSQDDITKTIKVFNDYFRGHDME